ncbi:MAG: macro domain-containing protein [Eubacterium sp.]|nr:macro domain-containing protein [Eubacterium sp.]
MSFQIVRNDITKMHVDAIVNTANPKPTYGAGIDSAVYEAAGKDELLEKRKKIGEIPPGESVITGGYNLPAKHIIHTVGCAWKGGKAGEEDIIRKCYRSVFKVACENNVSSLAIPLLASGSYGFPKGIALRIALSEIESFMSENDMEVYLVVFDEKSVSLSSELYGDIDEYINDNYVEEKNIDEYEGSNRGVIRSRFVEDSYFEASLAEPKLSLEDAVKNLDKTFMELVFSFADEKGISDLEVQKKANLDRKAFSKLKCGTTKNPSKATALAFAVALELNLDDTEDLLSRAGFALSPCSKQDVIVKYFIEKEIYDMYKINLALFEHGEQLLGNPLGEMSPAK